MSDITPAASVLLARGPGSPDVFLVRRSERLRFFGGFWAFPGGKMDPGDTDLPGSAGPRQAAAARELFEETGVLLARDAAGAFPVAGPHLDALRRQMSAGALPFREVLGRLGLALGAADFRHLGDITTPPFVTIRFDTTFFVAHLPAGQRAEVWPGELDRGQWASAEQMPDCWIRGECLVSPPTVMTLEAIRNHSPDEAPARLGPLLRSLGAGDLHPIWFAPQVLLVPLRSSSLPPSAYTNAYVVGQDPAYLLDPGPSEADEQQRLLAFLHRQADAGVRLAAVVLTHQHPDHVGAAALCAKHFGVPIWAHSHTAGALSGRVPVTRLLSDGDRLDLGACPAGGLWYLEALHTPGHAAGHLAFWEPRYRLLFAGDMVSTLSSIIIGPPEGNLAVYLDSLRRLAALDIRLLLPGHGGASSRPGQTLQDAIAHRLKRERQLLAALGQEPRTVGELAPELYRGTPAELMRLAELQILAGLRKLQHEGRVEALGEGATAGWRRSG